MLRFFWVLLSALLDSLTSWLKGLCQEHIDISTVLRIERSMLMQQAKQVCQQHCCKSWTQGPSQCFCPQGKVPTREAIHLHYQEQMLRSSRESGLDSCSLDDEVQLPGERGQDEEVSSDQGEEGSPGGKLGEEPSLDPAPGVDGPEEHTLRVPSLGEQDHAEEHGGSDGCCVATTGHKRRAQLSRMDRVEWSSDEAEGLRWAPSQLRGPPGSFLTVSAHLLTVSEQR